MKILISGEGGQGVQIISEILAKVSKKSGLHTSYIPSFGVEQRGGASVAFLQIATKKITYPKFAQADIAVAMSGRAVEAIANRIDQNTTLIFDCSNIEDEKLQTVRAKITKFLSVPAREYANKHFSTKVTNMIFLGALLHYLPDLKVTEIKSQLETKLANKQELLAMDIQAIDWGLDFAKKGEGQDFKGLLEKSTETKFGDEQKVWQRHPELCKSCGLCIVKCPVKALKFSSDLNFMGAPLPIVDLNKCTACGLCQLTCPDGAIEVTKK